MFFVPKPGGVYLVAFDFRAVNKRIAIESVPLTDIHSAFHWCAKAKYFATLYRIFSNLIRTLFTVSEG